MKARLFTATLLMIIGFIHFCWFNFAIATSQQHGKTSHKTSLKAIDVPNSYGKTKRPPIIKSNWGKHEKNANQSAKGPSVAIKSDENARLFCTKCCYKYQK